MLKPSQRTPRRRQGTRDDASTPTTPTTLTPDVNTPNTRKRLPVDYHALYNHGLTQLLESLTPTITSAQPNKKAQTSNSQTLAGYANS